MMILVLILAILMLEVEMYDFQAASKRVQFPLFSAEFTMGKTVKGNPLNIYILTSNPSLQCRASVCLTQRSLQQKRDTNR